MTAGVACKTSTGDRLEVDNELLKDGHVHRFVTLHFFQIRTTSCLQKLINNIQVWSLQHTIAATKCLIS
jgi:hypothetical protein